MALPKSVRTAGLKMCRQCHPCGRRWHEGCLPLNLAQSSTCFLRESAHPSKVCFLVDQRRSKITKGPTHPTGKDQNSLLKSVLAFQDSRLFLFCWNIQKAIMIDIWTEDLSNTETPEATPPEEAPGSELLFFSSYPGLLSGVLLRPDAQITDFR